MRRWIGVVLGLVVLYLALGLAFHFRWNAAQEACRRARQARGEFVEPPVYAEPIALFFDVTAWPVYALANLHHKGHLWATPCDSDLRAQATPSPTPLPEPVVVRFLVEDFGRRLAMVDLRDPRAGEAMQHYYGPFVAPELLESWARNPDLAPGRTVSSPWPDSIQVLTVERLGRQKYLVRGYVVELSSYELTHGGYADRRPFTATVEKRGGRWYITSFAWAASPSK